MAGRFLIFGVIGLVLIGGTAIAIGIATSDSSDVRAGDPVASMDVLQEREVLFLEDHHVFLVLNEGEPLALSDDPQHLEGEHTEWCESSQMFETPTHGEKFDRRGNYYGGPAAKGLDRYAVRVDGDAIYLDLDKVIPGPERGAEKPLEPEGPFCVTD
ncbi:MAG: Rieske 2Fe-2S domain-containing protein [Actinomycetota bacterium]|nr:Rieske 2Fe-2S domain-containing protein [Actinomycetota bacterium]